jgi:hypothetical protein
MFKFKLFASVFALASAVLLIPTTAAAPAGNQSASGHGNVTLNGSLRTFSFNAVRHQDGTVTGEAEINNRDQDIRTHIVIDCLTIIANNATMSGVVTETNTPALLGAGVRFSVTDNGEGKNDPADKISLTFVGGPTCSVPFIGTIPIEGGNIQVKP